MRSAASLNMKEICLTAKHAGGFTMWPSAFTPYGVQAAINWRNGKGDVLREFVDAAKRWDITICYCTPFHRFAATVVSAQLLHWYATPKVVVATVGL